MGLNSKPLTQYPLYYLHHVEFGYICLHSRFLLLEGWNFVHHEPCCYDFLELLRNFARYGKLATFSKFVISGVSPPLTGMILTRKLVELLGDKKKVRYDRSSLPLFMHQEGIIRVTSPPGPGSKVSGNILVDRSLTSPIQVVNWESEPVNASYIGQVLEKALAKRKNRNLPVSNPRSAFRLVNGLSDGLPGVNIDLYGVYAVIHVYSSHWQLMVMEIAKSLSRLDRYVEGVYTVNRVRKTSAHGSVPAYVDESRAKSVCIWGKRAPEHRTIVEEDNGLLYHIQLDNGPALGLYLDQRENRRKVVALLQECASQSSKHPPRLLNTFSFTGSFSLTAAKMIGAETTSVDASELVQQWAKDNFSLNGIALTDAHTFLKRDVFSALSSLHSSGREYDVVLLDPPTISRVKVKKSAGSTSERSRGTTPSYVPSITAQSKTHFSSLDNYSDLVALASPLVAPGGYLVCFVNTHSLDKERWRSSINEGLESIIPKMKAEKETERLNYVRSYLRNRGVKVKFRNSLLARVKDACPSEQIIRDHYAFSIVDHWFQDKRDFTTLEGDEEMGNYLHGLVLKRATPTLPIPPVTLPTLKSELLHESRRGGDTVKNSQTKQALKDAPPIASKQTSQKPKSNAQDSHKKASTKGPWNSQDNSL